MSSYQTEVSTLSQNGGLTNSPKNSSQLEKERLVLQLRIVNFVKKWIEFHLEDFQKDTELHNLVQSFISKLRESKNSKEEHCANILDSALVFLLFHLPRPTPVLPFPLALQWKIKSPLERFCFWK